ncbi:hypothetical protein AAHA92_32979 [Salvia divinorum]|uniref:Uncharacterized protein n=1 Tax=Salvia divinorum TaxID=28513 RepID=A0ABD1FMG5_SALDI
MKHGHMYPNYHISSLPLFDPPQPLIRGPDVDAFGRAQRPWRRRWRRRPPLSLYLLSRILSDSNREPPPDSTEIQRCCCPPSPNHGGLRACCCCRVTAHSEPDCCSSSLPLVMCEPPSSTYRFCRLVARFVEGTEISFLILSLKFLSISR